MKSKFLLVNEKENKSEIVNSLEKILHGFRA